MNSDHRFRKWISDATSREVMEWLQGGTPSSDRLLGLFQTREKAMEYANFLYGMGAIKVFAVKIGKYAWGEQTGMLLVEVPDKREVREALFQEEARVAQAEGFDPVEDVGQCFILLKLD